MAILIWAQSYFTLEDLKFLYLLVLTNQGGFQVIFVVAIVTLLAYYIQSAQIFLVIFNLAYHILAYNLSDLSLALKIDDMTKILLQLALDVI